MPEQKEDLELATKAVAVHAIALVLITERISANASMSKQLRLALMHEATTLWENMTPDQLMAFLETHYPFQH